MLPIDRLPAWPDTLGSASSDSASRSRSTGTLTPAWASNGRLLPPGWSSNALSTCTGSMMLLSRPTARDCASDSAFWKLEVSLSIRMVVIPNLEAGAAGDTRSDAVAAV